MCSVLELQWCPILELQSVLSVDAAALYSQCRKMDRSSIGSAWELAWYPEDASSKAQADGLTGFLSLSLISLVDALFLLCPWFSYEVFYMILSFNKAYKDTGVLLFFSDLPLFVAILSLSISPFLLYFFPSSE